MRTFAQMFSVIVAEPLAQPRVFVHRDYMPRDPDRVEAAGVLDFQDAVIGPITYDLVSLFRDAFISGDDARVRVWARVYLDRAHRGGLPVGADFDAFWRGFEMDGIAASPKGVGDFRAHSDFATASRTIL